MIAALLLAGAAQAADGAEGGTRGLGLGWTGFGLGTLGLGSLSFSIYKVNEAFYSHGKYRKIETSVWIILSVPPTLVMEVGVPMALAGGARARDPWEPEWAGRAGWICYGLHFVAWGGLAATSLDVPIGRVSSVALLGTSGLALTFGAIQLAHSGSELEQTIVLPIARGTF